MRNLLLTTLILLCFSPIWAAESLKPLAADKAFHLSVNAGDAKELQVKWNIAPGYYLYKAKIKITADQDSQVKIDPVVLPQGHQKQDSINGVYQAYTDVLTVPVHYLSGSKGVVKLTIAYQGCSSSGFCYPPMKKAFQSDIAKVPPQTNFDGEVAQVSADPAQSSGDYINGLLTGNHLLLAMVSCLFLGILLAFTPCVLPMVPILSSIIVGYGRGVSTKRAFSLSLSYVLGMSIAYAMAGVIIALIGSNIQVALQSPAVIAVFSGIFVLLALSLFGLFEVRLPNRLHQRMVAWSHKHQGGTYVGVFFMGAVSTLIVSPCVSAPLVGVLAYIGRSGDVLLGGLALLSLGIGMGIPLLLLGASAGKLLPKAGAWMDAVKQFFGFLMLGLAIWMLARILPGTVILFLWSILAIMTAWFFWRIKHTKKIWNKIHQGLGLVMLSYGFILLGGAIAGKTNPFYIMANHTVEMAQMESSSFVTIKSMDELDAQLETAKKNKKQILIDFYADWCVSCVLMNRNVFSQADVQNALTDFILLRFDVTQNNTFDQAVLKRFHVIAPPTILFINADGNEMKRQGIVGEVSSKEFLADINRVRDDQGLTHCSSGVSTC